MACARIVVVGLVQGVFFRDFTRNRAEAHGLTGWVRNLPDGDKVEVVACGDKTTINKLVSDLRRGPPASDVKDVLVEWRDEEESFASFDIRYM